MREGLQTSHVRETAANLLLGRALQLLDATGGMVVFQDAEGRWQSDRFTLRVSLDELDPLRPVLEAVLEWTLYSEKPVAIADLRRSRWSQHLLGDTGAGPSGAIAATPLAQRGAIWGAIAVYRQGPVEDVMPMLGQLAELATEPLSSLAAARPEGIV
ncbi:MAG TPA: GAF domain-containing protein [Candidatus Dormibacteraeota bacterium]|nr:GAF domain-containing protein [Candidatus Dormibacteraeota bacterium]